MRYSIIKTNKEYILFDSEKNSLGKFYYINHSLSYLTRDAKIILPDSTASIKIKRSFTFNPLNLFKYLNASKSLSLFTYEIILTRDSDNREYGRWAFFSKYMADATPMEFILSTGEKYTRNSFNKLSSNDSWYTQNKKSILRIKVKGSFFKTKEAIIETDLDLSKEENTLFAFWAFWRIAKHEYIFYTTLIILFLFFLAPILSLFGIPLPFYK